MNTTTYLRCSEPTVRSHPSQAYSQCLPEPNHGYSPQPQYGSYYDYAPMPQQPMPVQAPVAKSSSSSKGLMFVAGFAVVGAAVPAVLVPLFFLLLCLACFLCFLLGAGAVSVLVVVA